MGGVDADGHPMVDMDDTWVHMNGRLVSYESKPARETDDGIVYTGDIMARLNGSEDIIIHVEWDPASDAGSAEKGHITGYDLVDDKFAFMSKGTLKFKSGDRIELMFDYYDEEGNLRKTESYGRAIRVTKQDDLMVEDKELEECDIEFLGLLTDVYQRAIMTETLEAHIGA